MARLFKGLFNSVGNQIFVAVGTITDNEFREVAREEKHEAEDHGEEREVEERLLGDLTEAGHSMVQTVQLLRNQHDGDDNTDEEGKAA